MLLLLFFQKLLLLQKQYILGTYEHFYKSVMLF